MFGKPLSSRGAGRVAPLLVVIGSWVIGSWASAQPESSLEGFVVEPFVTVVGASGIDSVAEAPPASPFADGGGRIYFVADRRIYSADSQGAGAGAQPVYDLGADPSFNRSDFFYIEFSNLPCNRNLFLVNSRNPTLPNLIGGHLVEFTWVSGAAPPLQIARRLLPNAGSPLDASEGLEFDELSGDLVITNWDPQRGLWKLDPRAPGAAPGLLPVPSSLAQFPPAICTGSTGPLGVDAPWAGSTFEPGFYTICQSAEIVRVSRDGTAFTSLNVPGSNLAEALAFPPPGSPFGDWLHVLFANGQIWRVAADGSTWERVACGFANDTSASEIEFSRDGESLWIASSRNATLYRMSALAPLSRAKPYTRLPYDIPVRNASFEAPLLVAAGTWSMLAGACPGANVAGAVPLCAPVFDWSQARASDCHGVVRPAAGWFATDQSGRQVAWLSGANGQFSSLYQRLDATLRPQTRYDLQVEVGTAAGGAGPVPYRVQLATIQNDQTRILASVDQMVQALVAGNFLNVVAVFQGAATGDPSIGEHLWVSLSAGDAQVNFDTVQLTATPLPEVIGAPGGAWARYSLEPGPRDNSAVVVIESALPVRGGSVGLSTGGLADWIDVAVGPGLQAAGAPVFNWNVPGTGCGGVSGIASMEWQVDAAGTAVLPAGRHEILIVTLTTNRAPGSVVPLAFVACPGAQPVVANEVTLDSPGGGFQTVAADTVDGQLSRLAVFWRGDANAVPGEGLLLTDAVFLLNFLFLGNVAPECADAADVDDNGELELTDAIYLLNFLFLGGAPPRAPHFDCGTDPTLDDLDCQVSAVCRCS